MILTERHAYANRWRSVTAEAKASFAALALVAAFVARPPVALGLALALAALAVVGARIPARSYAAVALVPASFLLVSAVTVAVSVRAGAWPAPLSLAVDPQQASLALAVVARSAAALAAMLFLALTTPMADLIALARRLHAPQTLVELMTVCYRAMFVLSEAIHDMRRAQAARLGYATWRGAMRSMGNATALLAVETWRRSIVMHQASLARCGGEELRFLEPRCEGGRGEIAVALTAGIVLVAMAALLRGGIA
jgi:cobalt/nickel transport system permease protein